MSRVGGVRGVGLFMVSNSRERYGLGVGELEERVLFVCD